MNEMLTFPIMVVIILTTAILSSVITTSLPTWGKLYNAYKDAIKRKLTRKKHTTPPLKHQLMDLENMIMNVMKSSDSKIEYLEKQVEELKEQMDNVAKNSYRRETNRKNNIRRAVREYLEELKNG